MIIVHLCRRYLPHVGGVEKHVREVGELHAQQGHEVKIITYQETAQEPLTAVINGVQVTRIPTEVQHSKLSLWQWMWQHRDLVVEADVIQAHDVFWWLAPVVPFVLGRVYTTFHGWEGQYPVRWQAKLHRWIVALLSSATIHVGGWIQEFYWDRPTAITYGGVNISQQSKKNRTSIFETLLTLIKKNQKKPFKVVFVGRLEAENDIDIYLEAIDILKNKLPMLHVEWIGDGVYREQCSRVGKVWGMIPHPEKYLASADVVLASSYLSILQSQYLGKVVGAVYSHPLKKRYLETYPGISFMLLADSGASLALQVVDLWQHPHQGKELAKKSAQFAESQSWKKVADMYEHLWQKKN